MDRETILEAVRREAALNGGQPLGRMRFLARTGIRETDWSGIYWSRWSDVVRDAGLVPNEFQSAHDKDTKLRSLLTLARKLGRFPTSPEMRLEKRTNSAFPNSKTLLTERGGRSGLLRDAREFCARESEFSDCLAFLENTGEPIAEQEAAEPRRTDNKQARRGYVYLIRSGKYCKIGITEALYRRAAQIANGTPEGAEIIHSFMTDDPRGIEAYWHSRFASKRVQGTSIASGEWFLLDAADINAFKLRKTFM